MKCKNVYDAKNFWLISMMNRLISLETVFVCLGSLSLALGLFVFQQQSYEIDPILVRQKKQVLKQPLTIPIVDSQQAPHFSFIDLTQEMAFYAVTKNAVIAEDVFLLLIRKTGQTKLVKSGEKVSLNFCPLFPSCCEVDLQVFSPEEKKIEVVFKNQNQVFDIVHLPIEPLPSKNLQQINSGSKIAKLSEIQWIGQDLFQKKFLPVCLDFRLILKSETMTVVSSGDFICLKEGVFSVEKEPLDGAEVIAEVTSVDEKTIQLLAFTQDECAKITVLANTTPLKPQSADFISSIRVRSENQVSCFIDKQPFVLKTGDIVFKKDAKWKVLRTTDEKQALMTGVLDAEVFVFDRIETKNCAQCLCGYFFNKNHSEKVFLEIPSIDKKKSSKLDKGK